jgi:hypothetical protein
MTQSPTTLAKDPLGPLDAIVSVLLWLLALGFAGGLVLSFLPGGSVTTYGHDQACAVVRAELLPNADRQLDGGNPTVPSYARSSSVLPRDVEVCARGVSTGLNVLSLAGTFSGTALLLAFVIAATRLVRGARREGLFTTVTASRTRMLAWVLIVGSLLSHLIRAAVSVVILNRVVVDPGYHYGAGALLSGFGLPLTEIVVGIGLVSVGRVLGQAVVLQREQDATI